MEVTRNVAVQFTPVDPGSPGAYPETPPATNTKPFAIVGTVNFTAPGPKLVEIELLSQSSLSVFTPCTVCGTAW